MQSKAFALFCLMVASATCALAAKTVQVPVIMFDDTDFSGGSQNFPVTLPANGCSDCENLVRDCFALSHCNSYLYIAPQICLPDPRAQACITSCQYNAHLAYFPHVVRRNGLPCNRSRADRCCRTLSRPTLGSHMWPEMAPLSSCTMAMVAQVMANRFYLVEAFEKHETG